MSQQGEKKTGRRVLKAVIILGGLGGISYVGYRGYQWVKGQPLFTTQGGAAPTTKVVTGPLVQTQVQQPESRLRNSAAPSAQALLMASKRQTVQVGGAVAARTQTQAVNQQREIAAAIRHDIDNAPAIIEQNKAFIEAVTDSLFS